VNVAYSSDDGEQHDPQQQQLRHSQQQQQQHHHHHNQHHEKQSPRPGLFVSAPADEESIRSMIQSKQKELQEMSEYQVQVLQAQAQDKDRALAASREKLDRLKADFTFNLGLIEERDGELAQFEGAVRDLQGLLHGKEVELSDAKVRLAEAAQQLDGERRRHAEREAHLLGRAKEARDEAEHLKWARDEAARLARADEEAARRDRERAAAVVLILCRYRHSRHPVRLPPALLPCQNWHFLRHHCRLVLQLHGLLLHRLRQRLAHRHGARRGDSSVPHRAEGRSRGHEGESEDGRKLHFRYNCGNFSFVVWAGARKWAYVRSGQSAHNSTRHFIGCCFVRGGGRIYRPR
jgi:hypothetical protein